jgi:hypothetical protein
VDCRDVLRHLHLVGDDARKADRSLIRFEYGLCPGGGNGRRARLRAWSPLRRCWFKSSPGHHSDKQQASDHCPRPVVYLGPDESASIGGAVEFQWNIFFSAVFHDFDDLQRTLLYQFFNEFVRRFGLHAAFLDDFRDRPFPIDMLG